MIYQKILESSQHFNWNRFIFNIMNQAKDVLPEFNVWNLEDRKGLLPSASFGWRWDPHVLNERSKANLGITFAYYNTIISLKSNF